MALDRMQAFAIGAVIVLLAAVFAPSIISWLRRRRALNLRYWPKGRGPVTASDCVAIQLEAVAPELNVLLRLSPNDVRLPDIAWYVTTSGQRLFPTSVGDKAFAYLVAQLPYGTQAVTPVAFDLAAIRQMVGGENSCAAIDYIAKTVAQAIDTMRIELRKAVA